MHVLNNLPCIFIANEFFDALPIKQFIKINDKWNEKHVKFTNQMKPEFVNIPFNMQKFEKKLKFKISSELHLYPEGGLVFEYLKNITNKIKLNNYEF